MVTPGAPTAFTISVRQVLELLDGPFAGLAAGVARGRYAFWLGSGISRERVDDLKQVISRVLTHLQTRIDVTNANCGYRLALDEAIAFANLSVADRAAIDVTQPIAAWSCRETILANLTDKYSRLLDIRVAGHADPDYLLWEAVDVPTTFAPGGAAPDCEHLCLAILSLEGVLPDVATANWDGLIETAVNELSNASDNVLRVCVIPADHREQALQTRLLKFHGCAVRAASNPTVYRALLIARQSQIVGWNDNPEYAVMRDHLKNLAVTKPTLMIGLSAQDVNIQSIFSSASHTMPWAWPSDPPAHVFTEDVLGDGQRLILRLVYKTAYDTNGPAIEASALFRAYAKAGLTALVLHILFRKLCLYLQNVDAPRLPDVERTRIEAGILALRNALAMEAEPDRLAFVRALVRKCSLAIALFRDGRPPGGGDRSYRPISDAPIQRIVSDANLATSGIRELSSAIGVLGLGELAGRWTVRGNDPTRPQRGSLLLISPAGETRIFFVANDRAGLQLVNEGLVTMHDADAILIHSITPSSRMARSPRAAPGRVGRADLRNVAMADLLRDATTADELSLRFLEEAVL
jgi:hypothetical protein